MVPRPRSKIVALFAAVVLAVTVSCAPTPPPESPPGYALASHAPLEAYTVRFPAPVPADVRAAIGADLP